MGCFENVGKSASRCLFSKSKSTSISKAVWRQAGKNYRIIKKVTCQENTIEVFDFAVTLDFFAFLNTKLSGIFIPRLNPESNNKNAQ